MDPMTELTALLRRTADDLDTIHHNWRATPTPVVVGPPLRRLMSYADAATYLGCGKRFVQQLAADSELLKIRIGSRVLFAQEDLDAYVDRLRAKS